MDTLEAMNAYIEKTKLGNIRRYDMSMAEGRVIMEMILNGHEWSALRTAFKYGMAKGYRMAMKNLADGK